MNENESLSSTVEDTRLQVLRKINALTADSVGKLEDIWVTTFGEQMCQVNLEKLAELAATFYEEVMEESVRRQAAIKDDIQKLYIEAEELKQQLNVNISVTEEDKSLPLFMLRNKLNEDLEGLREVLEERRDQIRQLVYERDELCVELGEEGRPLLEYPLPTEEELREFRRYLVELKAEREERVEQIASLRSEVKSLMKQLELSIHSPSKNAILTSKDVPLTKKTIKELQDVRDMYLEQAEEIRVEIERMKQKLNVLWAYLDVDEKYRMKFDKYYNQCTQGAYDRLLEEVHRCEEEKRNNLKTVIEKMRMNLVEMWDKCLKSEEERLRFPHIRNDCFTEDLLTLHEMELEDVKLFYEENKNILELIDNRKALWDRMLALEAKASEPNRYNNRGGNLLKEERERKMIAKKLPEIEAKLKELALEYEEKTNRKFTVFGRDVLEMIDSDWEARRAEKEKATSARKMALTPQSKVEMRSILSSRNLLLSAKNCASAQKISMSVPNNKRKRGPEDHLLKPPRAKRTLLTAFSPQPNGRAPGMTPSRSARKSPAKKKVIGTTLSNPASSIRRRSKRNSRARKAAAAAAKPSKENSVSYEMFQEQIEKDPASRSSTVYDTGASILTRSRSRAQDVVTLPVPRFPPSASLAVNMHKSPGSSRACSPATSGKKLTTTKELPILI